MGDQLLAVNGMPIINMNYDKVWYSYSIHYSNRYILPTLILSGQLI